MLKTKRLLLRELEFSDLQKIHQLHSLPESDVFNTLGIPETLQVTEELLKEWLIKEQQQPRNSYIFVIDLLETGKFIGLIALNIGKEKYKSAEVWYKLHKDFWGNGYTTEALTALLDFGFNQLHLHRIEAGCAVENIRSIKVLEKVGMQREGMHRKILPIRGAWVDNYCYGILEEDFLGIGLDN